MNARKRCRLRRTIRRREEKQPFETQWGQHRPIETMSTHFSTPLITSVPQASTDNRLLYNVWLIHTKKIFTFFILTQSKMTFTFYRAGLSHLLFTELMMKKQPHRPFKPNHPPRHPWVEWFLGLFHKPKHRRWP